MSYYGAVKIIDIDNETANVSNSGLDVNIQDQYSEIMNLYLYATDLETTVSAEASVDDTTVTLASVTGVDAGDVITIYGSDCFYQSLVVSVTDNTVTLASPIDCGFDSGDAVEVGKWKLNLDGSSSTITAQIKVPPSSQFDIYTVLISMLDSTEMGDGLFGGITALTNGILFKHQNSTTKNLPLITNNLGLKEIGFDVQYSDKPPAGEYGLIASKNIKEKNGVSIRLDGTSSDEYQLLIRDDLTDLDQLSVVVLGHVVV